MRGREEDEKEMEEEEEEVEKEDNEEDDEEEESFLLSRKLSRVSMSKSILLSEGFTVAVLENGKCESEITSLQIRQIRQRKIENKNEIEHHNLSESMTAWTLSPGLLTTVSASFLINESFLMFFSSSS